MTTFQTPKGEVLLRKATLIDAPKVSELRREALASNPTSFGSSVEQPDRWSFQWAEQLINSPEDYSLLLIAEYQGDMFGMAVIRRPNGTKVSHGSTINSVYLKPEWRGFGIMQQILGQLQQWAMDRRLHFIKLGVTTINESAHRSYLRFGFVDYATEPKDLFFEGNYYDEYLMIKYLV
jgi:RimJ/RimL family protein N-acetyltransferase